MNRHWHKQRRLLVKLVRFAISDLDCKPHFLVRRKNPTHAVVLVLDDDAGRNGVGVLSDGVEFIRQDESIVAHMSIEYHLICEKDFRFNAGEGFNKARVEAKRRDLEKARALAKKRQRGKIQLPTREEVNP